MEVLVASDHAGFNLKQYIVSFLKNKGHLVTDLGTHSTEPVDYPDYAEKLALELKKGPCERGILICGSGVGAAVAANKIRGIRAGLCHDCYSARQGVEHDDMNVLVLGARVIGEKLAEELVEKFLHAYFIKTEERFVRRLKKVERLEEKK